MKLIEVEMRNIKKVQYLHYRPRANGVTVTGGFNCSGKSSSMDAICWVIGGLKLVPNEPIRDGQNEAFAECMIAGGDGTPTIKCRRAFSRREDGSIRSELQIWDEDGQLAASPQGILNDALGKKRIGSVPIGFDPLAFTRMKPKEQAQALRETMDLDFSDLDAAHADAYAKRHEINLRVRTLKAHLDKLPFHDDAPDERVSDAEFQRQLDSAAEVNRLNAVKRQEASVAAGKVRELEAQYAEKLRQRTNLEAQLRKLKESIDKLAGEIKGMEVDADELKLSVARLDDIETADIAKQLTAAHRANAKVADNERRAGFAKELMEANAQAAAAESAVQDIADQYNARLAAAPWPVKGLGFSDDDGVTFQGRPFEQASSAEQLEISAAIGFASNPELKLLFVREGSLLDDAHVQRLAELAEKHGGQVILERVGEGECHVLMRDGEAVKIADECQPPTKQEFAGEPNEDS